VRWRWLQRARDAVEREEGWQLRLGAVEMSASGAEVQWRERHGGEHGRGGGAAKRGRGALSWRCSETSFFRTVAERVDEQIKNGRWAVVGESRPNNRSASRWTDVRFPELPLIELNQVSV
jgi:hypothetical protein